MAGIDGEEDITAKLEKEVALLKEEALKSSKILNEARKKLRICLLCVVSAAIIMGVLYCILAAGDGSSVSEGTLVYHECSEGMDDAGSIY